ncbi:hypothetical protein ACVIRO_001027 [Rhizobium ruizarguesonis]
MDKAGFDDVVKEIRGRASRARTFALIFITLLTTIGIVIAYFFLEGVSGPLVNIGNASSSVTIDLRSVELISELSKAFVRIASVIMAVFIINILVSFARYNLRVANYLDSRADCLVISGGDHAAFAKLLPILSVDPLDFIATPMNPYDTLLGTVSNIARGKATKFRARKPDEDSQPKI